MQDKYTKNSSKRIIEKTKNKIIKTDINVKS